MTKRLDVRDWTWWVLVTTLTAFIAGPWVVVLLALTDAP